jgi:hypothetical protein
MKTKTKIYWFKVVVRGIRPLPILIASILPQSAASQSINFSQSGGEVDYRSVYVAGNAGHKIVGITRGREDTLIPAEFSGDFSSIIIEQTGVSASTFAADIAVAAPSDLYVSLADSAEANLLLSVDAGFYDGRFVTSGSGRKELNVDISANSGDVLTDIGLSGGVTELAITQNVGGSIYLDYNSTSGLNAGPAKVSIDQRGVDSMIDITGTGEHQSNLIVASTASNSKLYLNTDLAIDATVTFYFNRSDAVYEANVTRTTSGTVSISVN